MKRQLLEEGYASQQKQIDTITKKYNSIDSLDRHAKLEILKNPKVNPAFLHSAYDRLAVFQDRWKKVADNAMLEGMSEENRAKLAGHYFDTVLAPQYAEMNVRANRDLWIKQSFKEATQYDISAAYDNNVIHSLKHGWNEGLPSLARFGETIYNVVSNFLSAPQEHTDEEYSRFMQHPSATPPRSFTDAKNPHSLVNTGSQRVQEGHEFWANALPSNPNSGWFAKASDFTAEQAAQLPAYVAIGLATGGVGGLAAEAFPAIGNLTAALKVGGLPGKIALKALTGGAEGTAYGVLTREKGDKANAWKDALGFAIGEATFGLGEAGLAKMGRAGYFGQRIKVKLGDAIKAGGDTTKIADWEQQNSILGLAARGKEEASQAEKYDQFKKEAASNMAAIGVHGQSQVVLDALSHVYRMEERVPKEPVAPVPEPLPRGNLPASMAARVPEVGAGEVERPSGRVPISQEPIERIGQAEALRRQRVEETTRLREAEQDRLAKMRRGEIPSTDPRAAFRVSPEAPDPTAPAEALAESTEPENFSVKDHEAQMLASDPARNSPIIAAANFIRHVLGGKRLSDLVMDSPEMLHLNNMIAQLLSDAASEIPAHVPEMATHEAQATASKVGAAAEQQTLEFFKQKVVAEAEEHGVAGSLKPEDIEARAKQMFQEHLENAQKTAAQELKSNPVENTNRAVRNAREAATGIYAPPVVKSAKPRYGKHEINFANPLDKAAYILANKGKSNAHEAILEFYKKYFPDATDKDIAAHADKVKKALAKAANQAEDISDILEVDDVGHPREAKTATPKAEAPKPEKNKESLKAHREEVRTEGRTASLEPVFTERTRRGKDSVSYSITADYTAYMRNTAKKQGLGSINSADFTNWLRNYYAGLDEKDFALHLEDNFYPQPLKDADIWFEHQTAAPGENEHPNFLAFMYNYKEQMPREMQRELEDRLVGTDKFQSIIKEGAQTQEILDYYSLGMYNHMDDFLGSGHWPKETNIFRTSFNGVKQTTRYQKKLLEEKMAMEVSHLQDSLADNPKAQKAAVVNLQKMQKKRMESFLKSYDKDPNSRETVFKLNDLITQEITKHGQYDRWVF